MQFQNLYSSNTLIAYSDSNRAVLNYYNIGKIVQNVFTKNRGYSKYPIAILSIPKTTATRAKATDLLTEWILSHLATKDISSANIQVNAGKTGTGNATGSAIYMWPQPFLVTGAGKNNKPVLVWVIYGDTKSLELALFSKMASSVKFLLDTKDLDRVLLSENLKATMRIRVSKQLDQIELTPVELPTSDLVTLETFEAYLQWTADKVNGESVWNDAISKANTTKSAENPEVNTSRLVFPLKEPLPYRPTLEIDNSHTTDRPVYQTQSQFNAQICEIHGCVAQLQTAKATLSDWIENQMTLETLSDLPKLVARHLTFPEQHGITPEVQEVVQILRVFTGDLQNMFDNYLCFYGETDLKQMHRFIAAAREQAKRKLSAKSNAHISFLEKIFDFCCIKVGAIFLHDNQKIIRVEENLADQVYRKILDEFRVTLENVLDRESVETLAFSVNQMKQKSLRILADCLDFNEKLNGVYAKCAESLNIEMEKCLKDLITQKENRKPVVASKQNIPKHVQRQVQDHLSSYMEVFSKYWQQLAVKSLDQREEFHKQICSQILENVSDSKIIRQVRNQSDLYFLHKNELMEHQIQEQTLFKSMLGNLNRICVFVTPKLIQVSLFSDKHGIKHIPFGPHNSLFLPPILAMTKNGFQFGFEAIETLHKQPDTVLCKGAAINFISNSVQDQNLSETMLTFLFANIEKHVQKNIRISQGSTILVCVPTWIDVQSRARVRAACRKAEFPEIFVIDEAIVGTSILSKIFEQDKIYSLTVLVSDLHLKMRIYSYDGSKMLLCALSQLELSVQNVQNPESLLHTLYATLVEQTCELKNRLYFKRIFIVSDLETMGTVTNHFVHKVAAFDEIVILREEKHVINALLVLSQNSENIRKLHEKFNLVATNKAETSTVDGGKRFELLQKCKMIRHQIDNKAVNLSDKSKNLIIRVLDTAEIVVNDENAPAQDVEVQCAAVESIVQEYMETIV